MQVLTLTFPIRKDQVCLAFKSRGLGGGYWNGFGGKLEENETIKSGAVREVEEETTAKVAEEDLEKVAINEFFFKDGTHLEVHVFFFRKWKGNIKETEEMRTPTWFAHTELPFEEMWSDDPHWLPRVLKGEKLRGKAWFQEDGKTIEKMEWTAVEGF